MEMTYEQQQCITIVKQKVTALFDAFPAPAHSFSHAKRVAAHATYIAEQEGADVFMCELAGWLHDIGRAPEYNNQNPEKKRHHELSYEMLQKWFREDADFQFLSDEQKLELLYTVRYHWNDMADQYQSAIILRDADKLDAIGHIGLERAEECFGKNTPEYKHNYRYLYQFAYWFKTDTAKKIVEEEKLYEPIDEMYTKILQEEIKPVEL